LTAELAWHVHWNPLAAEVNQMRRIATCAAAFLLIVSLSPSYAKGSHGGGRPATAGARAKAPKTTSVKTTGPKSTVKTTGATKVAHGKAAAPGQIKKTTTSAPATTGNAANTGSSAKAGNSAKTKTNVPKNPELQARLQAMLPGMTLEEAAEGFKNQGQFMAAVKAADRLDVPFQDFKAKMVDEGNSLGQTIQFFNPEADAEAEANIAESQASQDLK
jgi:hypothetical protein